MMDVFSLSHIHQLAIRSHQGTIVDRCVCGIEGQELAFETYVTMDGGSIVSCIHSKMILWSLQVTTARSDCGKLQREIAGMSSRTTGNFAVAYSPKGDQIAYGCVGGSLRLMDVVSGICLHTLEGHDGEIESIAYSPRGDLVISGGTDKTVRLWDAASGECHAMISGFLGEFGDIACMETLDHIYLAAGFEDGFVGMWRVTVERDHVQVDWHWITTKNELSVEGTSIQDAGGLSQLNRELLKQRGAVGEPVDVLREASKKVVNMAFALSKFQSGKSNIVEDVSAAANPPSEQLEQEEHGQSSIHDAQPQGSGSGELLLQEETFHEEIKDMSTA